MTLHFTYNKQEVIEALRFHFMQRPEIKLFKVFLILVVVAAFAGFFTHYLSLNALLWIFCAFIVLALILWYILPFSVYRRAHTFQEPELSLQLSDDFMVIGTQRGESRMPWQQFNNVVETKDFFYLYRTNKSFFLIPVSAFQSRENRISFSEMLQKHFSNYLFK